MFVEALHHEALVAFAIEPLHLIRAIHGNSLARRLAEPPVEETGLALLFITARPAPKRPDVDPEQLRRLRALPKLGLSCATDVGTALLLTSLNMRI